MTVDAHKETRAFETEVSQVLNLVIRSLYSNKEIFLRELVSNASDAAEKLRFEALTDDALYENAPDLRVRVSVDADARTVTVSDNGVGMSRQEVAETIGSIASSGTRKFLQSISGDEAKDNKLIGQFGVGFYSAFIVADKVTLTTRRAGVGPEHGVRWESDGSGTYTLETIEKPERGTEIVLHLKEDEGEFLDQWRLRAIINRFSDHIAIPIEMPAEPAAAEEDGDSESAQAPAWEQVNQGTALWMRNKSELGDDDYKEFYKHIGHDFEEPLAWTHNRVEGTNEYTALLYVPKRAPFDLWDPNQHHGVKLYVRRVFVMDEAEKLMPRYLRFVRGVVDSDDLPLNVSREILQHNRKIDSIRTAGVKRILGVLEGMAKDQPEKYAEFWGEFGRVLKEGPAEDRVNAERIAGLLRFASTNADADTQDVSLDAYIERMPEDQEKIYYITAETAAAARHSPHLEIFRKKGIEVLLLSDRVDEWLVANLPEYKGKTLQSVAKGAIDLDQKADAGEGDEKTDEGPGGEHAELLERMKKALGGEVKDVRVSHRLVESPACLVVEDFEMSQNLARVLKQMGQDAPAAPPILEINPGHPLVSRLESEAEDGRFGDLSRLLLDQAQLAEGGQLDDPATFVQRLNRLMLDMAG
jgi:molecular chaperone HtpG